MADELVNTKVSVNSCDNDAKLKRYQIEASCRPSTSRGLSSQSSGDYDGSDYTFCEATCSCESLPYVSEKPCSIADSSTLLPKSKWKTFKNYIRSRFKGNKKEYKKGIIENKVRSNPIPTEEYLMEVEGLTPKNLNT